MSKIVVANWKMNPQSQKESETLFGSTVKEFNKVKNIKLIICPPFPFLLAFKKIKRKNILLGAQDVSRDIEGSHTGEVSPRMIKSIGVSQVIVGHGECRSRGETNKIVNEKIISLLKFNLAPILCVGESKRDRDGFYLSFVGDQIRESLNNIPRSQLKNITIAYEPIWAIGKDATREATKEEFIEMKIFIKKVLSDIYDAKVAHDIPILYGGSVSPQNAGSFVIEGEADGLLVGRDSLNPKKFGAILNALN